MTKARKRGWGIGLWVISCLALPTQAQGDGSSECRLRSGEESVELERASDCSFHEGEKIACAYWVARAGSEEPRKSTLVFRQGIEPSSYCLALKKLSVPGLPELKGRLILESRSKQLKVALICESKPEKVRILIFDSSGKHVFCEPPRFGNK